MGKLIFKDKWEFACAIKEHKTLWDKDGCCVFFAPSYANPFRLKKTSLYDSSAMSNTWDEYNKEWYTEEPLKHLDLIWHWDDSNSHMRRLGFWDAKNNNVFSCFGVRVVDDNKWDNYEKFQGEWPEWAKEAVKTLPKEDKQC